MTVEQAIAAADRMRPNNPFTTEDKYAWLRGCDGMIRAQVVSKGADIVESDELGETTLLLVPLPYDGLYPHYLAGQMDAALGESDRASNELAQYNALLSGFSIWMRQTYMPAANPRIRY